ncbi:MULTISPECIES: FtsW/RodA/SpoVE family cell cycle protein [Pontibacillus]|uniref:FtsW/RodA/SpoVE family cell cycle protein n=1 Tax=Pontibacillus chungwhensis TaxID=265426 RepID=A0ABY8UUL6_9BACI|nr:FtsW/RodA/SpoVE family cell cycle protein [Pontibacillus chungwhensis]MCD5323351.1 rod shape-determining protein RodA [Pontibacillus sp. HN14]WIF96732.1 FtsW/RodA/SpoVE family cell cycle protein [Pontibacillus chungwhensis]
MNEENQNHFDIYLLLAIFSLMAVSCVTLVNTGLGTSFFLKQLVWFVLSLIIVAVICFSDFYQIRKITPYLYGAGLLALVGVIVAPESIAPMRNGAKSWFVIQDRISIQPSEFMKVFLILMLAVTIARHAEKHAVGLVPMDLFLLCKLALVATFPIGLTLLQNDFGTSLVMLVILASLVFVSGISWKIIIPIVTTAVLIVAALVGIFLYNAKLLLIFLDEYQLNRIYSWLDPSGNAADIGYQLKQSLLTVGSGMLFGNEEGVPVPEVETDFIFSLVAGRYGYIGGSLLIMLYFVVIFRIVRISIYNAEHPFESLLCVGVIGWLSFHVFQNVGMVIGLLPITGIPLPLLSYGGSSVLAMMIGLGLVLNVSLKTKDFMFSD